MDKRQWMVAGVIAGIAVATVWACGPNFPNQLLDHREGTLKATPQNSFAFEASHLLLPTDALQASESDTPPSPNDPAAMAKAQGLSPEQWARVVKLREAGDGKTAFEDGKDLPDDLRWYTAGAVDFTLANLSCEGSDEAVDKARGERCEGSMDEVMNRAVASFEKVLALPPEKARLRSVWAAYMLGRIHAERAGVQSNNAEAFKRERDAAAKAFELARTHAVEGAGDTQGLAVASFGEEARLHLYTGGRQCGWNEMSSTSDDCGHSLAASDLKHAMTLYAAQAGHGSRGAVQSLSVMASIALDDDKRAVELIDNPVSQQLLVAYALARMGDEVTESAAGAAQVAKPNPRLVALVSAIEQRGLDHVAGADRLAALAYSLGRYDLAAKLVDKASGPLASWVRAKLALQKGDLAAATAAYADAAKAFPKANDPKASIEATNVQLMVGEQGVLALARGEYVEAMGRLYDAANAVGGSGNVYNEDESSGEGYGNDAAYVAERVLTLDELKAFVDAHAPASPAPAPAHATSTAPEPYYGRPPLADNLRWLLARRLMRAGRYDDAQSYFPVSGDRRFGGVDLRAKAREYANALHDGEHAWTGIGKAEGRYAAAVIEREQGMELFGYEQGPDYTDIGGSFQGGSGHSADDLKQALVTDGERQRYAESGAKPDLRFHYRYLASDRAASAADLLPQRSQAFAAVLCHATGWMLEGPPDYSDHYQGYGEPAPDEPSERKQRSTALYQRYVKQGPHVDWAAHFGRDCEEPDFDRARAMQRHQYVVRAKHMVRHGWPLEIGGLALVVGGLVFWRTRRRKSKAAG
ncbi:hypothetical protein [Dyella subtropica]|uniref:hypothetical protein n=1 Tax=Dyella subtropica TaxID=2992127 RepID=UPI0022569891|nr:hypothetical protein [Dyella subtropica]